MPPKKSFQPLPGQKKLRFGGQPLHTNDDEPKSVPESERVAGSASTSDNDSEKKKRKFLPQCLKNYGWLKYDEDKNFMYCDVCTKFNRNNSLHQNEECRNYQHTTLVRHALFNDHQTALQIPELQKHLRTIQRKSEIYEHSRQSCISPSKMHSLCVENIPLSKFKSLQTFCFMI